MELWAGTETQLDYLVGREKMRNFVNRLEKEAMTVEDREPMTEWVVWECREGHPRSCNRWI